MKEERTNETPNAIWKLKANFFIEKNTIVHISLKSGTFYNGTIKKILDEHLTILDRESGELPVFYGELLSIEPYINPEEQAFNKTKWKGDKK